MKQSMGEIWGLIGSKLASILFMWAMIQRYLPNQFHALIDRFFSKKLANLFNPYVEVRFFEYTGDYMRRNEAFSAIEHYLASKSSNQSRKLKGEFVKQSLVLKMDEQQEVNDEFQGIKLVWSLKKIVPKTTSVSFIPADEKSYYLLTFHGRHRGLATGSYLNHVLGEGKAIGLSKRQRKLYTNCVGDGDYEKSRKWSHVIFEHPASFETIAMDPEKKKEIIDDLTTFREAKEYYARIGKPWKRGYLLYGPPGTGKSTLVAAIANFMRYDIYDIELTNVKTNAELRKLLIGITSKSVVVIEDIDCSLDLTGQRETNSENGKGKKEKNAVTSLKEQAASTADKNKSSKVTLSGLLNFIDGIWSASTGERLIIFTTNYVGKLDEALIRRGRMDMHIELSYCGFEGFKVLAKNYLNLESHPSFGTICYLLEEKNMTPADVAENLMPKVANENIETSLERLIQALRSSKEAARAKAEKEQGNTATEESNEEESSEEENAEDVKQ
ncbi:AAA-ATPase At3g28510-like [Lotus japonicus]|uniref:AAA-ATPase At3g28510-like n=1 Tax=Lotus japonicus TaxID=34305 RepID=UPI00258B2D09|nr:AAA-ATPase At3g28510-like [Lotus japonicus]